MSYTNVQESILQKTVFVHNEALATKIFSYLDSSESSDLVNFAEVFPEAKKNIMLAVNAKRLKKKPLPKTWAKFFQSKPIAYAIFSHLHPIYDMKNLSISFPAITAMIQSYWTAKRSKICEKCAKAIEFLFFSPDPGYVKKEESKVKNFLMNTAISRI